MVLQSTITQSSSLFPFTVQPNFPEHKADLIAVVEYRDYNSDNIHLTTDKYLWPLVNIYITNYCHFTIIHLSCHLQAPAMIITF